MCGHTWLLCVCCSSRRSNVSVAITSSPTRFESNRITALHLLSLLSIDTNNVVRMFERIRIETSNSSSKCAAQTHTAVDLNCILLLTKSTGFSHYITATLLSTAISATCVVMRGDFRLFSLSLSSSLNSMKRSQLHRWQQVQQVGRRRVCVCVCLSGNCGLKLAHQDANDDNCITTTTPMITKRRQEQNKKLNPNLLAATKTLLIFRLLLSNFIRLFSELERLV